MTDDIAHALVAEASHFYGLGDGHFFSQRRGYSTRARDAVSYVLLNQVGWCPQRLARFYGKPRSTIYAGIERCAERFGSDDIFHSLIARLQEMVAPDD